ncbi:DUF2834 domain-containing protein (plasmid) [Rhodococcus opacus]|uniref:DUF2834 domain-containing protein n=1 Tax=Rhodococcus opacus TaxID=37919 RepID=UPI0034D1A959
MTNPLTGYSTATNVRHALYIVTGIAAVLLTWPYAFDWMSAGGNILNPITFFGDGIGPGGTAAFLSIDMLIAWAVFTVWVVTDTVRIGMGLKSGVLFVALSYIGVSMAFPFYLVARERFLIRNADQLTSPTVRAST